MLGWWGVQRLRGACKETECCICLLLHVAFAGDNDAHGECAIASNVTRPEHVYPAPKPRYCRPALQRQTVPSISFHSLLLLGGSGAQHSTARQAQPWRWSLKPRPPLLTLRCQPALNCLLLCCPLRCLPACPWSGLPHAGSRGDAAGQAVAPVGRVRVWCAVVGAVQWRTRVQGARAASTFIRCNTTASSGRGCRVSVCVCICRAYLVPCWVMRWRTSSDGRSSRTTVPLTFSYWHAGEQCCGTSHTHRRRALGIGRAKLSVHRLPSCRVGGRCTAANCS